MKKIIFMALVAIAFSSCSKKETYSIEGSVQDARYNNKKLVVQKIANSQIVSTDTLFIGDGKFSFKGDVDSTSIRNVYSTDTLGLMPFVYVVEKGNITIEIIDNVAKVGGTPLNDKLQVFSDQFNANTQKGQSLIAEFAKKQEEGALQEEEEAKLSEALSKLAKENTAMMVAFAKENIDNILGEYCFTSYYFLVDSETKAAMREFATPKIKALLNI